MKFICLILLTLLPSSTFTQQAYYSTPQTNQPQCPVRLALKNQNINWGKNFICNGEFETPKIPTDRKWQYY